MNTVACYRRSTGSGETMVALHREGCRDLRRESDKHDAYMLLVVDGLDPLAALATSLYGGPLNDYGDPYIIDRDVTVYPCTKAAAK